jgi:hypothetical protein
MNILESTQWRTALIYGPPHPNIGRLIVDIAVKLVEEGYNTLVIDANHRITPDMLISIEDKVLKRILLIKPSSIKSSSDIMDYLVFDYRRQMENIAVIYASVFIQIPYHYWTLFNYDPLFIIFAIAELSRKIKNFKGVVFIDTNVQEPSSLPYHERFIELFDIIYKLRFTEERFSLEPSSIL